MSGILETDEGTFMNQLGSVPIGDFFSKFVFEDGKEVSIGDYVYFDDPDAGMHVKQCPLVMDHEFIGYVKKIYAHDPDYGDRGPHPEVSPTSSLGRLDITDGYVCIVPSSGPDGHRGEPLLDEAWGGTKIGAARTMSQHLYNHDEFKKSYQNERHGGWGAIGKEKAQEINACSECIANKFGPNYTQGK